MNRALSTLSPVEYGLALSDGSIWSLSGANDQTQWVDKLATIMELKTSRLNGSPKLIFSSKTATGDIGNKENSYVAAKLSLWGRDTGWAVDDPASLRVWCTESIPDVICEVSRHDEVEEIQFLSMWYTLLPIYQRSICLGGLPFHAGLVELDGRGVLLAAPGDKGKSTSCRRLPEYWRTLCDDEALVVADRHKKYRAHPFPTWSEYLWKRSEKTWNVQYSLPLSAIFFLEQAKNDSVEPLGDGHAAVLMTESASQIYEKFWRRSDQKDQREFREELFNNACTMAKKIPCYRLYVNLHGRFWEKMEEVLEW
jgi:SynChlorMet cassette protein ScmC